MKSFSGNMVIDYGLFDIIEKHSEVSFVLHNLASTKYAPSLKRSTHIFTSRL